eukprot:40637-Prorocentrum_minimum.AAC.1
MDQSDTGSTGIFSRRTNQIQEARVYSHDGPLGRRKRGYVLTTDHSDVSLTSGVCKLRLLSLPKVSKVPLDKVRRKRESACKGDAPAFSLLLKNEAVPPGTASRDGARPNPARTRPPSARVCR